MRYKRVVFITSRGLPTQSTPEINSITWCNVSITCPGWKYRLFPFHFASGTSNRNQSPWNLSIPCIQDREQLEIVFWHDATS